VEERKAKLNKWGVGGGKRKEALTGAFNSLAWEPDHRKFYEGCFLCSFREEMRSFLDLDMQTPLLLFMLGWSSHYSVPHLTPTLGLLYPEDGDSNFI
jgi:hypothetical protein